MGEGSRPGCLPISPQRHYFFLLILISIGQSLLQEWNYDNFDVFCTKELKPNKMYKSESFFVCDKIFRTFNDEGMFA